MPGAKDEGPDFSESGIRAHQTRLDSGFQRFLHNPSTIRPYQEYVARWPRRPTGQDVEFFVWGKEETYAERKGGRIRCPVVRAIERNEKWEDHFLWICWKQTWRKKRNNRFNLIDTSFTFFWGRRSALESLDDQLFRAEWTQSGYGSDIAGHPHWQVDWTTPATGDDISGVHFGMAGWDLSPGEGYPKCWQRFTGSDLGDLELWCFRILEYSIKQLVRHFRKNGPAYRN